MSGRDDVMDAALRRVARGAEARDDEAWVKRVASRVGPFAGTPLLSRSELDALLAAPADDDADVGGDFDGKASAGDDHAAHAADHSHGAGAGGHWDDASLGGSAAAEREGLRVSQTAVRREVERAHMEDSMSEEEAPKKNDLGALAGLTRSSLAAPAPALGEIDGAAKGDDSGRIDLRAMLGTESTGDAPEAAAATAAAVGKPDDNVIDIGAIQRASAPPKSSPKAATAATAKASDTSAPISGAVASSAAVGPAVVSSASASAVAAKPADKKGGGMIYLGVALAAAAAIGVGVIALGNKKSEESAANKTSAPAAAAEKKDDKATAVASASATAAPPPATVAMNDPAPTASVAAPAGDPGGAKVDPKMAPGAAPTATGAPGTAPAKAAPTASASAKPAPTNDPIHKPSGGSLDDVLGIGKDDPSKKAVVAADSNLPEKPDTGDIRSAVLGKQGAAQACVKGLDGDSSVAVTFGPAGNVTAVVVTAGPAKGTGAEACIKNAFNGAKVPASKKGGTGYAKLLP